MSGHNPLLPDEVAPHIFLMFFALAIQLVAAAISGIGYSLNQNVFCLVGFVLFTLWFIVMLITVNPHADKALNNHRMGIRRGALIVIVVFIFLGVAELATAVLVAPLAQRNNTNGDFTLLLRQMKRGFITMIVRLLNAKLRRTCLSARTPMLMPTSSQQCLNITVPLTESRRCVPVG